MRSSPTEGTGALPAGPLGRSNSLLIPLMSRGTEWLFGLVSEYAVDTPSLAKRSNNDIAMTRGGRHVASQ